MTPTALPALQTCKSCGRRRACERTVLGPTCAACARGLARLTRRDVAKSFMSAADAEGLFPLDD
jgi:hypothetical protein